MFPIVFQHPDFIIINKPAGISVHRDDNLQGLTAQVAKQLGIPQVWLVHRLDKMTSGLLILALNAKAAAELSGLFAQRNVEKFYIALSDKQPRRKQGKISGDMVRSRRGTWKLLTSQQNPAITQYFSAGTGSGLRLFLLRPATGKTHQIRVALKSEGAAILGDSLYGNTAFGQGEIADRGYLHAWQLRFTYQETTYQISALPESGQYFALNGVLQQLAQWAEPWTLPWPVVRAPAATDDELE